jgi:dipeptidyl aminopeptidase/acylaminoacyl peptidase
MVVLPHGGPVSRDYQRFDYMAQFLASRGYAVLQPNFRGSIGYGHDFLAAGMKQWGLTMQDDLEDGTRAMIDRGIADPERICIAGWSYGGYAALMGAARTPELFACAAAGAAVTDIPRMLKEDSRYKFRTRNPPSVGHYRKDRDKLRDNSPINNVDVIQVPILLVHGDKDRVVPYRHSKKMAARLKKDKKPHVFVTLENGDHHLSLEQNRIRFLKELEAFLAEHLRVSVQTAP